MAHLNHISFVFVGGGQKLSSHLAIYVGLPSGLSKMSIESFD